MSHRHISISSFLQARLSPNQFSIVSLNRVSQLQVQVGFGAMASSHLNYVTQSAVQYQGRPGNYAMSPNAAALSRRVSEDIKSHKFLEGCSVPLIYHRPYQHIVQSAIDTPDTPIKMQPLPLPSLEKSLTSKQVRQAANREHKLVENQTRRYRKVVLRRAAQVKAQHQARTSTLAIPNGTVPNIQSLPNFPRTRRCKAINGLIPDNTLDDLYSFLGLGPYSPADLPSDVIFMSFDFENWQRIDALEAGIAVLDSRDILSDPETAIRTYNGVTESRPSRPFFFGETVQVPRGKMLAFVQICIPQNRKLVLVGHDIGNDLNVLQRLGFDIRAHVVGIFDTALIGRKPGTGLKNTLMSLGCDFYGFHNSGNDANFTLKVLLLLAAHNYIGGTVTEFPRNDIEIVKNITAMGKIMCPVEYLGGEIEEV